MLRNSFLNPLMSAGLSGNNPLFNYSLTLSWRFADVFLMCLCSWSLLLPSISSTVQSLSLPILLCLSIFHFAFGWIETVNQPGSWTWFHEAKNHAEVFILPWWRHLRSNTFIDRHLLQMRLHENELPWIGCFLENVTKNTIGANTNASMLFVSQLFLNSQISLLVFQQAYNEPIV